ncbi:hypothetical protein [uncultured Clostridium sp.]|uniref:hypothetical protein n=1 Tax=uncultured Clostridium sp. TaxID=59620 RepID=UPI00260B353F|nr:hypothetical protein [uncultured Clostridium sp.]
MKKSKKGNILIECIIGMFIVTLALSLVGGALYKYYIISELEANKSIELNCIEILKKEIKYNLELCTLEDILNKNEYIYIGFEKDLERKLLEEDVENLFFTEEKDVSIKKIRNLDTGIEISVKVDKYGYEESFEKEKWMEEEGEHIN